MNEKKYPLLEPDDPVSFDYPEGLEQAAASFQSMDTEEAKAYIRSILICIGLM